MSRFTKIAALALASATALAGTAQAGGFDRGGVNVDLLFSEERVTGEATFTHVMPQRTIENVERGGNEVAGPAIEQGVFDTVKAQAPALVGFTPTDEQIQQFIDDPDTVGQALGFAPGQGPAILDQITQGVTEQVNAAFPPDSSDSIDIDGDYTVPRLGINVRLTEDLSCLASYNEPFGADADYGTGNAYSVSAVEFSIDTRDYGLTCAYRFTGPELGIGQSYFRVIGGVSYQELEGFQSRQRFLDFANAGLTSAGGVMNTSGLGTFDLEGDSVGWRIGAAFEVPDIALRAQLIYHSKYEYDLEGFQDNRGFETIFEDAAYVPVSTSTEIPQAVELKLQSGIAPGTLAFLNIKWQEWSQLGIIPIEGGKSPVTGGDTDLSFDPLYRDGWTVTAGLGREFTDSLSGSAALTWDRGTATTTGTQTDTWTLSGGIAYEPNENFELRLGGAIGLLTGGESIAPEGGDSANNVTYTFGDDFVGAVSGGLRVKF